MLERRRYDELRRLLRYGIVGISINGVGFAGYLALVWLGLSPVGAVSALYPAALLAGLALNRRWTFGDQGPWGSTLLRFLLAHACGYLLNLLLLQLFVGCLGVPHAIVQACAVFIVAALLYLALRFFVFNAGAWHRR